MHPGVRYGGGKHAVLLKNPETFAKVCQYDNPFLCLFPLTGEKVGYCNGNILQRRYHNYQAVDIAALFSDFSTPPLEAHHLERQRLRGKLLADYYFAHHLSMPTDPCSLGHFREGPLPQAERGIHRPGYMQYHYRHDRSLPTHATHLALTDR